MRLGIFIGTFNPFHGGHLSVYNNASQLFDEVILGVAQNPEKHILDLNSHVKKVAKEANDARECVLREKEKIKVFGYLHVNDLETLLQTLYPLTDLEYWYVRGIRGGEDFDADLELFDYVSSGNVVYIPSSNDMRSLSSTDIRSGKKDEYNNKDSFTI